MLYYKGNNKMIENSHLNLAFKFGKTPAHVVENLVYSTIMGSMAYNCHHKLGEATEKKSDFDVYGIMMLPREEQFPQLFAHINGYDAPKEFEVYQKHHIISPENNTEYDLNIYPFPKYLKLCADNNPNMLDSLFTDERLVLHESPISVILRENRKVFLSKLSKIKLMGYAHGQFRQLSNKIKSGSEKRQDDILNYGYDLKKAYHVIRLALQAQQILVEHDLNITRNAEILKDIRAGNWSFKQLMDYFNELKGLLEKNYHTSTLRNEPDQRAIKQLMFKCFEEHYGSLTKMELNLPSNFDLLKQDLNLLLNKYK